MAFPQGIPFRSTSGFVTDGANDSVETSTSNTTNAAVDSASYPRTSAQGNNVGYETGSFNVLITRDRSTSVDPRLAGLHGTNNGPVMTYRIDMPTAGYKAVRLAVGDNNYSFNVTPPGLELFDGTTRLRTLESLPTNAAAHWMDATMAERTSSADWVSNNASITERFLTTILRVNITHPAGIAYLYVEDAATPPNAFIRAKYALFPKTVMRRISQ